MFNRFNSRVFFLGIIIMLFGLLFVGCVSASVDANTSNSVGVDDNSDVKVVDKLNNSNNDKLSVDSNATSYATLQSDINNASSGSVIRLTNDIVRESSETNITIKKNIIINGNGFSINANGGKCFILNSTSSTLSLVNITVMNAKLTSSRVYGAVINATNYSRIVLNNSVFINNSAPGGGVIATSIRSNINMTNCTFVLNKVTGSMGGAVLYTDAYANLRVKNCNFSNNTGPNSVGGVFSLNTGSNSSINDSVSMSSV